MTNMQPSAGIPTLRSMGLHRHRFLRRAAFAILPRLASRDISISHHWVDGAKLRLNLFRHRGYWYHGRGRESGVMSSLARLIQPGDTVIEAGAHIGYISIYLAKLTGPEGKVFVFEPSRNNLRYLTANVASFPQVEIVPEAVGDTVGQASFYVENLSGQNSSLIQDYENLERNNQNAFSNQHYNQMQVNVTTIDSFVVAKMIKPDFLKIDIEGAELMALSGMTECLARDRPKLMVEVTNQEDAVMQLMAAAGYKAFDNRLRPFGPDADQGPNRFFIPEEQSGSIRT